jgi:molybdenum cofactor cytidylyltransferase
VRDGRVVLAVLAAGAGARFAASGGDGHKLLARVGEHRLVDLAVGAALASGAGPVAVVVGASPVGDLPGDVEVIANPDWAGGIATSVQAAVHWAEGRADAVVIGLADQPGVRADAWRAVAAAPDDPPIAVATYGGRRGNPVRLHRSVWPLLPVTGDAGARALFAERPHLVGEVRCDGDPADVDTVEDLHRWS